MTVYASVTVADIGAAAAPGREDLSGSVDSALPAFYDIALPQELVDPPDKNSMHHVP